MAVRRLHPEQPTSFEFTPENLAWAQATMTNYPQGQQASAVIPLLWRAQEQHEGWLPEPAIRYVAELLGMAYIRVYEIATFYTMFQLAPVGKIAHVQVCGTTPCMLRGSENIIAVCKRKIAKSPHELSADGNFSWEEVECLGSCANAPMVQIWKDTYEDLTSDSFEKLLDAFAVGEPAQPGSQTGRRASCPSSGPTTLLEYSTATPSQIGQQPTQSAPQAVSDATTVVAESAQPTPIISDNAKPVALEAPRDGKADDLKRISGVGPKLEETLHGLGIYHFDQIAEWGPETVAWVDNYLSFKGRINREGWIDQAKALAAEKGD